MLRLYIGLGKSNAQQHPRQESLDYIDPTFGISIVFADTSLAFWRIAVGPGHVMGETTPVNIDNRTPIQFISFNLPVEGLLCGGLRLGMAHRFFLCVTPGLPGACRIDFRQTPN